MSLAILDDTGWYEVNYSMGEPYPWGDGRSMLSAPLATFPNSPPQRAFPRHYLCWEKKWKPQCNYDFLSKAFCSPAADFNCMSKDADDLAACRMREFVNPLNLSVRGDVPEFDYRYFKVGNASQRCEDEELNKLSESGRHGEVYGKDSMCAMSSLSRQSNEPDELRPGCHTMMCDAANNLMVRIGNEIRYCRVEDEQLEFDGFFGVFVCPNPQFVCGMKRFLKRTLVDGPMPTENPVKTVAPVPTVFPQPTQITAGEVFATVAPASSVYPKETDLPASTLVADVIVAWYHVSWVDMVLVLGIVVLLIAVGVAIRRRAITHRDPGESMAMMDAESASRTGPEPRLDIPLPPEQSGA
jgi:hypothetical protein